MPRDRTASRRTAARPKNRPPALTRNPDHLAKSLELGAKFFARLPESNGTYKIELKSPTGERLRTITGGTTNSYFEVHWELTDDRGRRCTNDSYDSVFHITLPDSGRSQKLRGP
jgi:hypothetical protein